MLDVMRLRVLAAVARSGSVTAAARLLGYSQPSVSHHLARLEAETGSQLVQRVGRGIRLTDAGRILAERSEEILGRLDAAEAELGELTGLRVGRVRLAAFPSALGTFVPRATATFTAAHPNVELSLVEEEPPEAIGLLRSGDVDIALTFRHPDAPPWESDLRQQLLLREAIYLVTPADVKGTTLSDHAVDRWIAGCERCRAHLMQTCAAAGFVPDIRFTTDDYVAVQELVVAGLGVTTLPQLALAAHRHADIRATRLSHDGRVVTAATYGEAPDPPATAALLQHLARAARASSKAIT